MSVMIRSGGLEYIGFFQSFIGIVYGVLWLVEKNVFILFIYVFKFMKSKIGYF